MDDKDIKIDPSVLKEKKDSYTSLTDKYEIELFTDKTQEVIEKVNQNEKLEKKEKKENLFVKKIGEDNIYLGAKKSLFLEERNIIVNENNEELISRESYIITGIIIALFIIVMISYYKLRRRKLNEISVDYYDE